MRRLVGVAAVCAALGFAGEASAQNCGTPPVAGTFFTRTFTDQYGQTTYQIVAPCKVFVGVPFDVTLTVTDTTWASTDVGQGWALLDNGAVVAGGGFNWITTDAARTWQRVIPITYPTLVVDHILEFRFRDMGQGYGAHFWSAGLIGALTVDPYPPGFGQEPVVDAGPDLAIAPDAQAGTVLAGTAVDPEGVDLTFRWLWGANELTASAPVVGGAAPLPLSALAPLAPGAYLLTLEATDGAHVVRDDVLLEVASPAPALAPVVTFPPFQPRARGFRPVIVAANPSGGAGGPWSFAVEVEGPGRLHGRAVDHAVARIDEATGEVLLLLRMEPSPWRPDWTYLVRITATDAAGASVTAEVPVTVARAQR
jgi:hypothetical protein